MIIHGATLKGSRAAIQEGLPGTLCASNPWNAGTGENNTWTGPEQPRVPSNFAKITGKHMTGGWRTTELLGN